VETHSGKGSLLLGLAVGLGFQLGHHLPAAGKCILCCLDTLPLPNLQHLSGVFSLFLSVFLSVACLERQAGDAVSTAAQAVQYMLTGQL